MLDGEKTLVLTLLELNSSIPEELVGMPTTALVEEGGKSFVCPLILTISTILDQLVHPFFLFYMVENMTLGMAQNMT